MPTRFEWGEFFLQSFNFEIFKTKPPHEVADNKVLEKTCGKHVEASMCTLGGMLTGSESRQQLTPDTSPYFTQCPTTYQCICQVTKPHCKLYHTSAWERTSHTTLYHSHTTYCITCCTIAYYGLYHTSQHDIATPYYTVHTVPYLSKSGQILLQLLFGTAQLLTTMQQSPNCQQDVDAQVRGAL